jgi:phosphatidylglycerophosphate synthase
VKKVVSGLQQSEIPRPQRPRELQDPLNHYLYHPLAWKLARRLAGTPITPNMVSVFGGLMVVIASFSYVGLAWPIGAILGMAMHMGWHVLDGADGDLARLTGRSSPIGEMVDGLCDYLSHIVLYTLLGWMLWQGTGYFSGWNAVGLILAAGLSHAIQANHAEVQKRQYQYWVYGTPWLRMSHNSSDSATARSWASNLVSAYIGIASGMTPHALKVDAAVASAADNKTRLMTIAQTVRAESPSLLFMIKLLGPNPRAVLLGLSTILTATPLWYLLYQAIILNLFLIVSVKMHNASAQRIAKAIMA